MYAVACSFASASPFFISQAWQAGDLSFVHKITIRGAKLGLLVMVSGISFLILVGQELITLWLGKDSFVGYPVLITFCLMFLSEIQYYPLSVSARATEFEKFVAPVYILSALLNCVITWFLISKIGLLGVALGTLLSQMLTNGWYQLYIAIKRLKINFKMYFREVTLLWMCLLLVSTCTSWILKNLLIFYQAPKIIIISGVAFNCLMLFTITLWMFFIEDLDRKRIKKSVSNLFLKT